MRLTTTIAALAALVLLAAPAARAGVEAGADAYRQADFPTALKELMPAAEKGDPVAQYLLGKMYSAGLGVERDQKKATDLFKSSAEAGLPYAQADLGNALVLGDGIEQDFIEGIKWLLIASDTGLADARRQINAIGAVVDRPTALEARLKARQWESSNKTFALDSQESVMAAPVPTPTMPVDPNKRY